MLLNYGNRVFFKDAWKKWDKLPDFESCYANSKNSNGVTLTLSRLTKGIFLVIGVGFSTVFIFVELIIAAYIDKFDPDHTTYSSKLAWRLKLKTQDIKTDWFKYNRIQLHNELPLREEDKIIPGLNQKFDHLIS